MIRRSDQWSRLHVRYSDFSTVIAIEAELIGSDIAVDGPVARRGSQILADGDDVDADRSEIGKRSQHLFLRLPHPHDQARLDQEARCFRSGEEGKRPSVTS